LTPKEKIMPFVTVSTARGILDIDQNQSLLRRITDLMVEIEGQGNPDFRQSVWVKIEEQEPTHWSLGGMMPTAEMIATTFGPIAHDGRRAICGANKKSRMSLSLIRATLAVAAPSAR
jgi:4-oxalocrotonate tautomerase